ncbi:hypothetical protein LUZ61_020232 [Rhynchospora tenuis]|uniref:HAT C-terminal dimerisation domain-containing protein n=1 Tax=Rhynchospora tenuis TaxID=198213 RepID=A0AAD6ENL7_9POAL|nr:hypothetical protein LUZ61_020232 [Rhynchospora tenuis]
MGAGLHFETQEEIEKIQEDAPNDPNTTGQKEPPCEEEGGNPKKRKTRKVSSKYWKYFNQGPTDEDGSYYAICKYCEGTELIPWVFDEMKCRKALAIMSQIPFKKPTWDVPTRWNSTYLMLVLALELKPAICRYGNIDKRYANMFKWDEFKWDEVECLVGHLKVFYEATLKLSGTKYPTLNLFFPEFAEVYLNIKRMSSSPYPFIVQMGAPMIAKFDKYWTIGNSLLAIACVLDPRCKLYVVEYYMKELCPEQCANFMANLRECMKELFNEYVQENASDEKQGRVSKRQKTTAVAGASGSGTNSRAALKDYIKERRNNEPQKSELDDYLATELDEASVDEDFDILAWWRLKSPKYPILCQLTKDILAVPISTVASESAFSTSGRILSPARSSLNDESIEALLCAQDWLRASINENGEKIGEPLWNIEEGGGIEE